MNRIRGFCRASVRLAPALLSLVSVTACLNYGLSGGGGFPSEIRTVFIAPVGNNTDIFDVPEQISTSLQQELPRALGLRLAGERVADAVVRGTVTRYEDAAQNYRPGGLGEVEVLQHQVQITMSVQIIDVRRGEIIYEQQSVSGLGQYQPDTQSHDVARAKAIETLIQQIINGAQSQW